MPDKIRRPTSNPGPSDTAEKLQRPTRTFGHYAGLAERHRRFVDEYLIDLNAYAAGMRAGFTGAKVTSYTLLDRPDIQAAIRERQELFTAERFNYHNAARFILGKLWDCATADPRELMEIRRVPCRYCWGINNQYQFSKAEMDRQLKAHAYGMAGQPLEAIWPRAGAEAAAWTAGKHHLPFDSQGGEGYTTDRAPNPACPECAGVGITMHLVADTRHLSASARQIFRGAKIGRNGQIEILVANQDQARDMLARHYNIAVDRKELYVRTIDPGSLSDEELTQAIAQLETLTLEESEYRQQQPPPKAKPGPRGPYRALLTAGPGRPTS